MVDRNYAAIQFLKYDLGFGVYAFRPIGLLVGDHDLELETFETNFGETYESIKYSCASDEGTYFYAPMKIEDLKKAYGLDDENLALNSYYDDFLNFVYLGLSNDSSVDVVALKSGVIEEFLNSSEDEQSLQSYKDGYFFTDEYLRELISSKSLREIREKLNNLLKLKNGYSITIDNNENLSVEQLESKKSSPKHMKVEKENSKKMKLSELKKEVLDSIIGQDDAVNSVTTTIIVNENSKNPRHKSHILIAGPSGTGKTEMMNIISKKLNKPVFKADATAYTKEGYVGKSVYSMLKGLLDTTNGDLEKAQNGILVIDEIDKKVSTKGESDVSGTAVLNSLLKIMDRDIIEVDTSREETVQFDTSNLTIVFMGAFSDLYEEKEEKRKKAKKISIGFSTTEEPNEEDSEIKITKEDLVKYGLPPEFLGRISKITFTKPLTEENLIKILKQSKISPLKMEQEFFEDLGITFKYTNGYVKQLAENCLKHKTGARELKSEVQKSLEGAYEEVLDNPQKVKVLKLTKETVKDNKKYCIE